MGVDPEQEPTTEPQAALEPSTEESSPADDLGDAGKSTDGPGFVNPISGL
jgi:hypothetical protein